MEREPPDPDLIRQYDGALIEMLYTSRQSGQPKVFRGTWTSVDERDNGSYRVEVRDDLDEQIRIADTGSEKVKNHRLMILGPLERLNVYAPVE